MRTEHHEDSYTFSKPTTWTAVNASEVALITDPGVDFARLPVRVVCSLRLADNPESAPCVRLDYFIEALWNAPGGEPTWHDITSRVLRPEDDGAACALFAETEEEAFVIDEAIEKLLGVARPGAAPASPRATSGGVP
jgi:hypothetical protein